MIDGPHRSLNMPPHWKSLAMQADMEGYSTDDMKCKFEQTLNKEWNSSIDRNFLNKVKTILANPPLPRFEYCVSEDLELLKNECSGNLHAKLLLDYAINSVRNGQMKSDVSNEFVCNFLIDRSMRSVRQIEEHYLRKSGRSAALKVKSRIERCLEFSLFSNMANNILRSDAGKIKTSKRQTGLDEGVPLL